MAHLYNEQGVLALKHLIGHFREETITGNQIMIAISYAQLVAGCSLPYLQEAALNRSYVLTSWLGNIKTFLQLCNGKLIVPNAWLPHTQREHDQILMDVFECVKLSSTTLEQLNM
eukprot:13048653-Ditylum_brightwellii.AAC.1